jgi:hypothetical protein
MDTKHTPGPWKVVPRAVMEDGSVYPAHIVGGPNEFEICWLESPAVADLAVKDPEHWDKPKVNAQLIAAAPKLLEALVWYVENDDVIEMAGNEFWLEGREKARAAIGKARG